MSSASCFSQVSAFVPLPAFRTATRRLAVLPPRQSPCGSFIDLRCELLRVPCQDDLPGGGADVRATSSVRVRPYDHKLTIFACFLRCVGRSPYTNRRPQAECYIMINGPPAVGATDAASWASRDAFDGDACCAQHGSPGGQQIGDEVRLRRVYKPPMPPLIFPSSTGRSSLAFLLLLFQTTVLFVSHSLHATSTFS
jgi:hypothetical protein